MKYILGLLVLLSLASCADEKNIKGTNYQPYGWADYQDVKSDKVVYKVNVGNVVWSIIGFETLVVPVYLTGWQLYEPVRLKSDTVNTK